MKLDTLAATPSNFIVQMTENQTRIFVGLYRAEELIATAAELRLELDRDANVFQVDVMLRRLEQVPEMQFSMQAMLMALTLSHNVAAVVMWAYTLVEETRRGGVVTMHRLADLFPMGFPNEKGMSAFWDRQKIRERSGGMSDNWLDTQAAWSA